MAAPNKKEVFDQLNQFLGEQGGEQEKQAQTQEAPVENRQRIGASGEADTSLPQAGLNIVADFNTGLANLAGVFGTADELLQSSLGVDDPDSILPTVQEMRTLGSRIGATRAPGEEADNVAGRFAEEVGAGALPFIGAAARTSIPLLRLAGAELVSASGATAGGIALENSPTFKDDPQMGRLVGELFGGLSALSLLDLGAKAPKSLTGAAFRGARGAGRKAKDTFRGEGATNRAAARATDVTRSPDVASSRLGQPTDVDVEAGIRTPATVASDPGVNKLTAAVMDESPESAEQLTRTFSEEATNLRRLAFGEGRPDDVRNFIENKVREAGARVDASIKRARGKGEDPAEMSRRAREILDGAYGQARTAERRMWSKVPDSVVVNKPNSRQEWLRTLDNAQTETRRARLPKILKKEFGTRNPKTGKFKPGSLPENPTAKQLHELYSELGDAARSEASKQGGSADTVRILKNVRREIMNDLMSVDGGDRYKKAVNVSRNLNDRFTRGTVGEIMGFSKSGTGVNSSETLETVLRGGGERKANAIRDMMRASPKTGEQVEEFMRDRFVQKAINTENGAINTTQANKFLQDNSATLELFPNLREEISRASKDQADVDSLLGKSNVSDLSIHKREKTGAAAFLNSNPNEEAKSILGATKDRRRLISDLVTTVKEDPSGKALEGTKSSFVESLFDQAGTSNVYDEITQSAFPNGIKLKERIAAVQDDLVESGLFSKEEVDRLNTIADRLSNIQRTMSANAAKGGVINDAPGVILSTIGQLGGASGGRQFAELTGGGNVQTPNIFVTRVKKILERLTNDEARNILVRSVKDKDTYNNLLELNPRKKESELVGLLDGLLSPLRDTAEVAGSATARPAATAGEREENQNRKIELFEQIQNLPEEEE